jgi:hypothetical protein
VLASARRLAWVVAPTWTNPRLLADALTSPQGPAIVAGLRDAAARDERLAWEGGVLSAIDEHDVRARAARLNEQLSELDWRAQRWSRVPQVCARVAASAGFLFGTIAVIVGLGDDTPGASRAALVSALDAAAIGIAGTAFCVAIHLRARRALRERLAGADRLVDQLEKLGSGEPT